MQMRHCLVVIGVVLVGCAEGRKDSARDGIDATYKTLETGFRQGNAGLIAASYTPDAELYAPRATILKGAPAISQAWKENGGSGGNRLHIDVAEVEQDGNRANEVGRFTISAPDGAVLAAGTHLIVWARQADGRWKARRGMFNWDIPPRPASAGDVR